MDEAEVAEALRSSGARFASCTGAGPTGDHRRGPTSTSPPGGVPLPRAWDVELPDNVDLLVLDGAPLELTGRVALHGRLLFDDDPPARVAWQAQTRLIYLDEQHRQAELDQVYFKGRRHGR